MESRSGDDRNEGIPERRRVKRHLPGRKQAWVIPRWADQRVQFLTRYLFGILGVIYFNFVFGDDTTDRSIVNIVLGLYFIWLTVSFVHAYFRHDSIFRFRLAMWVDILVVSIVVYFDPFVVPLNSMIYIVIVLGNGMRYGIRCFSEALLGSFLAAMISLSLRYSGSFHEISSGVVFLNIFGGIILVYAYILMRRVDASHKVVEHSSRLDPLTGLVNRRILQDAATAMIDEAQRSGSVLTIMFADLDSFKQVNDSFGHNEGDRVLIEVANIIRQAVRDQDVAGRYGGDEFVLLLRDTPLDAARPVARRIQQQLSAWAEKNALEIGISIGMGEAPTHGNNFKSLMGAVDRALYRSKFSRENGGISTVTAEDIV